MLGNLLKDHETIIKTLRKHIEECQELEDEGTANFLTDKMEEHEKMAWMLDYFYIQNNRIFVQRRNGIML